MPTSNYAHIGLGGNVGDVVSHMQKALNKLNQHKAIEVAAVSNVYKTPPWGMEDQDWFLNACAELKTTLTAHQLLDECLATELCLKRVRNMRWGPRTIDLDVLFFGNQEISDDKLQIPHPRIQERAFVLMPMADIAPQLILKDKTIMQWADITQNDEIQRTNDELSLQNQ